MSLAGMVVAVVLLAAAGAGAQTKSAQTKNALAKSVACGKVAPEVLGQTVGAVAAQIYAGEVSSSETIKDRLQVESYGPLLRAVAANDKAAARTAVTSLVYSHTHIVRLRVSSSSKLLADVGGPYILAPLSGSLRLHGHTIGHYILSVQDDVGYVKIEHRFIGDPLVLRAGAQNLPVEGLVEPGPAHPPDSGPVTYQHVAYQAYSFKANAFPSGPLWISIMVPLPAGLSRESCTVVRNAELRVVTRRVSGQLSLSPANFQVYVNLVQTLTNGLFYVRAGSRELAGSTRRAPAHLPKSGSASYHGVHYEVSSFQAPSSLGSVRIYELFPE